MKLDPSEQQKHYWIVVKLDLEPVDWMTGEVGKEEHWGSRWEGMRHHRVS